MRAILVVLAVACVPEDEGADATPIDDGGTPVEDPGGSPPEACSGPSALNFFGDTSSDVLVSGVEWSLDPGGQGGFHLELGLAVESPEGSVAWHVQTVDPATGELLMESDSQLTFTGLTAWNLETCTGYLPVVRVVLRQDLWDQKCVIDGMTVRAEAYVTTVDRGEEPPGEPQQTLDVVVNAGC